MDKDINDVPLSESNVSLKLANIQKRCSALMEEPDTLELSLEEPVASKPSADEKCYDPYDRG